MTRPRNDGFSVGVIGCGNMGAALARGMVESRLLPAGRIVGYDSDRAKAKRLARSLKVNAARSVREVAACSVVLLAVKPQQMGEVLAEIRPHLGRRPLLISIAAGIRTRWIERRVGRGIPVVRVMPNMPALVRRGISAIARGASAGLKHQALAGRIFSSVGEVVQVEESRMDAVTAVSGSGPAYFFYLMEQLEKAGTHLGLPAAVARRLAVATAAGAGKLACCSGEEPARLRARVTSKGGTTEAAFNLFRRRKLDAIIQSGIRAAARRAKELSE